MSKKLVQTNNATQIGGTNFLVSIYHQENQSWQGAIQWLDTGKKVHFRSELEMLNLMQQAILAGQTTTQQNEEQTIRTWQDDHKINVG